MIADEQSLFTRIRKRVAALEVQPLFSHMAARWVIMTVFFGLLYLLGWRRSSPLELQSRVHSKTMEEVSNGRIRF
jgi:hypothetical protein